RIPAGGRPSVRWVSVWATCRRGTRTRGATASIPRCTATGSDRPPPRAGSKRRGYFVLARNQKMLDDLMEKPDRHIVRDAADGVNENAQREHRERNQHHIPAGVG